MKYFKMVSGKGRVEMSESEMEQLFGGSDEPIDSQPTELELLKQKVESLSQKVETLSDTEILKTLLSLSERLGQNNGAL